MLVALSAIAPLAQWTSIPRGKEERDVPPGTVNRPYEFRFLLEDLPGRKAAVRISITYGAEPGHTIPQTASARDAIWGIV